jgi:hypothetical protein
MTFVQQRQKLLGLIGKACTDGARLNRTCPLRACGRPRAALNLAGQARQVDGDELGRVQHVDFFQLAGCGKL